MSRRLELRDQLVFLNKVRGPNYRWDKNNRIIHTYTGAAKGRLNELVHVFSLVTNQNWVQDEKPDPQGDRLWSNTLRPRHESMSHSDATMHNQISEYVRADMLQDIERTYKKDFAAVGLVIQDPANPVAQTGRLASLNYGHKASIEFMTAFGAFCRTYNKRRKRS